jgi:hypothetical protein
LLNKIHENSTINVHKLPIEEDKKYRSRLAQSQLNKIMVNKDAELKEVGYGVNYTLFGKANKKEEAEKKVELFGGLYGSSPPNLNRMSTIDYAKMKGRYKVGYPTTLLIKEKQPKTI